MKPEIIGRLNRELVEALDADQSASISINTAAKLLNIDDQCLRVAIARGSCPFAVGGEHERTGHRFGRISKLALYNWLTKGVES